MMAENLGKEAVALAIISSLTAVTRGQGRPHRHRRQARRATFCKRLTARSSRQRLRLIGISRTITSITAKMRRESPDGDYDFSPLRYRRTALFNQQIDDSTGGKGSPPGRFDLEDTAISGDKPTVTEKTGRDGVKVSHALNDSLTLPVLPR